ncbi:LysR-family transcriptional regulator [Collimonas arenae]|uniref:LysR-family transcriptional regulator n=1 Tax=Collimonas arenae TaxID=279058 RepID=A0A0A1FBW8_9BURK|nr:LysR family transcriptional regulator [Collimonas arenae]AIY40337.1 LysR-family transcriptional regulator [Collimonas arenae]
MNLTLEALQILDTIDRKGSFAAAAIELDRVPSALTYSVRKLEEDLDVLLFDRRGHRAKLTVAGLELLTEGRHLLLAAQELERRVKRAATGWEVELRIVLDSIIPFDSLLPLIEAFDRENAGTRLRISHEALSGVWEALLFDRADLAIGAPHSGPDSIRMSGGFQTRQLGMIDWVFAVAPDHPLANAPEPLTASLVQQYRAVAVGDTGRTLPSINSGLLNGQDILTVPSITAKLEAQLSGLGCGHLPRWMAAPYFASGALIEKQTTEAKPSDKTQIAWRTPVVGKSLKWFIAQLSEPATQRALLGATAQALPSPGQQPHHESTSNV